jgi:hypothetical protein
MAGVCHDARVIRGAASACGGCRVGRQGDAAATQYDGRERRHGQDTYQVLSAHVTLLLKSVKPGAGDFPDWPAAVLAATGPNAPYSLSDGKELVKALREQMDPGIIPELLFGFTD